MTAQLVTHAPEAELIGLLENEAPITVSKRWPTLNPAAYHGWAGRIVKQLEPTTEADPAAMLPILLAQFGAFVGTGEGAGEIPAPAHMMIANTKHAPIIWPIIVGTTSSGAKGTAQATCNRIVSEAVRKSGGHSPNRMSGLSSGEGLIEAIRDESGDPEDEKKYKPGVEDKRLLLTETEFAGVLGRMRRDGSTLGPILRQAWDCDEKLGVINREAFTASNPHIVIVAHISPGELNSEYRSKDVDGGTLNRFLFFASRRSKRLPTGGNAPDQLVAKAATHFAQAVSQAWRAGVVETDEEATARWAHTYNRLTAERPDTVLTKVTGRRAPQVLRLAMLYALLDKRKTVTVGDLEAAEALEQYSVDTAEYIFAAPNDKDSEKLGKLAEFVREGGASGRSRNEIREDHFRKHIRKDELDRLLKSLIESGAVSEEIQSTGGRNRAVYVAR